MASTIEAVHHLSRSGSESTHLTDLVPVLQCLDQLLLRATQVAEAVYGSQFSADPYRGLYINQDEVNRLFSQVPCAPRLNPESAGMNEEQARLDQSILASPLLTKLSETFCSHGFRFRSNPARPGA